MATKTDNRKVLDRRQVQSKNYSEEKENHLVEKKTEKIILHIILY